MFAPWTLIFVSFAYLALLFAIAYFGDRRSKMGRSIISNPYIYSLSMAVYCSAWTFYGSVGRAANAGLDFLTIYLGPMLMIPLWGLLLKKIIRICKVQRITSIADFISSRYGKSATLGTLVSIICVLGIIPYISLQLKAIALSLDVLSIRHIAGLETSEADTFLLDDTAFYVTVALALFTILFGTRNIDTTERHEGLVTAIAFESLVKLIAFIAVGIFVTYGMYNGLGDIFTKAASFPKLEALFTFEDSTSAHYDEWFWHLLLSTFAIILLPRQFQVAVVENVNEKHINKAMWLFPLYLFAINFFVLPIAMGGAMIFDGQPVDADTYVLTLPMLADNQFITMLVYVGGFSASTGMVIVAVIALSTMISNNLVMPILVAFVDVKKIKIIRGLILIRRASIFLVLFLAYLYFKFIGGYYALVSTGLISFAAVAQFAPAFLGGLFWKRATKRGAISGLSVGFIVWFYTLVIPSLEHSGLVSTSLIHEGPFGIAMLKPLALFGLRHLDSISHALLWSLFFNVFFYMFFSLLSVQSAKEHNQAEVFVDIFKYSSVYESSIVWKGTAYIPDIKSLLVSFLGRRKTELALHNYATKFKVNLEDSVKADPKLVNYAEKLLSGAIGAASARIMLSSVVQEEPILMSEVMHILRESQQLLTYNKELKRKSQQLKRTTEQLMMVNQRLKELDTVKDEFITTVTHELRTPLTSIRALSEILYDHPDLEQEQQRRFLDTIIKETERLSRLISQVLDLEKFDSGKQEFNISSVDVKELVNEAVMGVLPIADEKEITIDVSIHSTLPPIMVDKDRLIQVLVNLVSNAVKYCEPGYGQIVITAFHLENEVRINVKDNGVGISPDKHEAIFDRFYQVKNHNNIKPGGSGLGLAISKKIIEYHKGKIWVESDVTKGAKFCISLPAGVYNFALQKSGQS